MARPLRIEFAGAIHHLMARGNARQAIFCDAADRQRVLHGLAEDRQLRVDFQEIESRLRQETRNKV